MSRWGRRTFAGGLVAILTLTGCTTNATPVAAPTPSTAAPEGVADVFLATAADLETVGALLYVRTPDTEYTVAYGSTEDGTDIEPAPDTTFRVGSITKTFTATTVLTLVDEGRIGLDDPVSRYRDDVPGGDAITIRMLLSMTSGLGSYTDNEEWITAASTDTARVWDPEELLALGFAMPQVFAPGTDYQYSNTNTVLLGVIAEQVTGTPLRALFAERVFAPLGLEHTSLPAPADIDLPTPYAHGYVILDDAAGAVDATHFNPSWAWAAGGAYSTASDLADWAETDAGNTLLDPALQAERLDSIRPLAGELGEHGWGYGLGIAKVAGLYGHTGSLPGYNSFFGHDPDSGLTVVIWANFAPSPDGRDPANTLADAVVPLLLDGRR